MLRILHLEDDPADARLISDAICAEGLPVKILVVGERRKFVAALKRGDYDVMLSDYKLPAFDGLEALMLWRERWRDKPFIFVTGSMGEDLAVESLKCGATDYILKDNLARLVPAIRRAVAEAVEQARRQQAEAALRESEARFRSMADGSPFMIWLSGTDTRCTWFNRTWLEFVGRTMEQELGNGWAENVHPDDFERALQTYVSAFEARRPFRMEYRLRRHDGEWRWVSDHGSPHYGPDRQFAGYIGSCLDETERKLGELALRENHRQEQLKAELGEIYSRTLEPTALLKAITRRVGEYFKVPRCGYSRVEADSGLLIVEHDYHRDGASLAGEYSIASYAGSFADDWRAGRVIAIEDLKSDPHTAALYEERFAPLGVRAYVCVPLLRAGQWVAHFWLGAAEVRVWTEAEKSFLRSVADRAWLALENARANEALRASEAREREHAAELEAIMEAVPAVIWIARDPECRVITGNQASHEYLRLPRDVNASKSAPDGERPANFEVLREGRVLRPEELPVQRAARGESLRNCELENRFTDGTSRYLIGNATPLRDAQGNVSGAVAAFVEITERKRAEEALKLSLHEKEVLLREVHHRVKNNLQVISSLVSLQADASPDPGLHKLLQDVRDRVRTMALLHEKLYASESLALVDFSEYMRSLLDYLWYAHARETDNIRLHLDLQPVTLPMDQAVPCGLLLNEVATNAFKHAFRGRSSGQVSVALHQGPDGRVNLDVQDDGVGLPADLDWRHSPTLGLKLVRMLAGQLNGTVDVKTDGGTGFLISFGPTLSRDGRAETNLNQPQPGESSS